jgi:hypothetical protein
MLLRSLFVLCAFACSSLYAQTNNGLVAKYTFNHGDARNDIGAGHAKLVGVTLTEDRFGNDASAYYFHGNPGSYISLGTADQLKPWRCSISMWFKMDNIMYAGRGYCANPLIIAKTHPGNDFNEAINLAFEYSGHRLSTVSNRSSPYDSLQAGVRSLSTIKPGKWYHAVMFFDDTSIGLYLDGVLQNKVSKSFRTTFLPGDSVVLGYSANEKNVRFFNGTIDDVEIFNRVISGEEVLSLYRQDNPHPNRHLVKWLVFILLCVSCVVLIMVLLLRRERVKNKKQRQIFDMERQIMRAQMNPHFIFNAINSVQQFILEADNESANKYLVKFSRLLRTILESNSEEYISLENELDILTKYIEIEALRFDNSFRYEITVEAGLNVSKAKIPQMMIQPFIENAIWHGLLPKKTDKTLSIGLKYVSPNVLECTIDDNGIGRNFNKPSDVMIKKRSLAINFINDRLELISKELKGTYNVQIIDKRDQNDVGSGTCVILKLPILN